MKIFISGKLSGLHYKEAYSNFAIAESKLKQAGHEPVNPLKSISAYTRSQEAKKTRLSQMLQCDGIFLLDDWKKDPDSQFEFETAVKVGMYPYFERDIAHLKTVSER